MDSDEQKFAFWLMPAGDAKDFFASLVDELAARLNAPRFEPHVTLQGAEMDERHATGVLDAIATANAPLELQVAGVQFSGKYTKTLYVQFRPSAAASAISDAIATAAGSDSAYQFDPHLSLLYKTMGETEKEELARNIDIPFRAVRFDSVKLIHVPCTIKAPEDVHAWRTVAERPLTGRSA
jgi:2'-5' RNA ligase